MMYSYLAIQSSKKEKSAMSSSCISFIVILSLISCMILCNWLNLRFVRSNQHGGGFLHARHQSVDILLCIIHSDLGPDGAGNAIPVHEWLCTVVSGTYGNA